MSPADTTPGSPAAVITDKARAGDTVYWKVHGECQAWTLSTEGDGSVIERRWTEEDGTHSIRYVIAFYRDELFFHGVSTSFESADPDEGGGISAGHCDQNYLGPTVDDDKLTFGEHRWYFAAESCEAAGDNEAELPCDPL